MTNQKSKIEKDFSIVIVGTGGQGIITLTKILNEAAMLHGFDVKSSELHGLSQRGGSVETHVRIGKRIFSPLVKQGGADLIIALEPQEALKSCYYGSQRSGTNFLVNTALVSIPFQQQIGLEEIKKSLSKFSQKIILLDATKKVSEETGSSVAAGTYMLSYAAHNNLLPLDPQKLLKSIKNNLKPKYFEVNRQVFELAVAGK